MYEVIKETFLLRDASLEWELRTNKTCNERSFVRLASVSINLLLGDGVTMLEAL